MFRGGGGSQLEDDLHREESFGLWVASLNALLLASRGGEAKDEDVRGLPIPSQPTL